MSTKYSSAIQINDSTIQGLFGYVRTQPYMIATVIPQQSSIPVGSRLQKPSFADCQRQLDSVGIL